MEKTNTSAQTEQKSAAVAQNTANQTPSNNLPEIKLPSLQQFLEAGCHFGHKTSRWNPKMVKFIHSERNGVHIIDLVKTMSLLKKALQKVQNASNDGYVLIIGTKGQAATLVQKVAEENGAFYVNTRWPGGLFTNFGVIKKSVNKLMSMEEKIASGAEDLVKKEELAMKREIERLNEMYEGIKFMDKLPSLLIVIDSKIEKNAIKEANIAGIPIVGLIDTNCDPDVVEYPVPSNDDSIKSISLFIKLFGDAINSGKRSQSLVALRKSYKARLAALRSEYEKKVQMQELIAAEERERIKRLRSGEASVKEQTPVVRVTSSNKSEAKNLIEDSKLGARVKSALATAGFSSLEELKSLDKSALVAIKGIGEKAADEILELVK